MFVRFRSARPSDDLAALRRFYVDALGCALLGEFADHDGFDGLIVGDPGGRWQAEFVHQRGHRAPPVPGDEHLLVFYVADRTALAARVAALEAAGVPRATPNNPYWARHGATFVDPDGYAVVVAVVPDGGPERAEP
jgi:catechol 2,3-dioxygenase-like lactoylglutathione lyase family enzyme